MSDINISKCGVNSDIPPYERPEGGFYGQGDMIHKENIKPKIKVTPQIRQAILETFINYLRKDPLRKRK